MRFLLATVVEVGGRFFCLSGLVFWLGTCVDQRAAAAAAAARFLAEQPDQYPDYHGREDDENHYVLPGLGLHVPVFLLSVCSYLFV